MGDFPYTLVTGKLATFLTKMRGVGIPQKADVKWLSSLGFSSSNDRSLLGVLKFIGLTDPSGIPTPLWSQYRGANHKKVLGDAVRKAYAELFAVYPDAWKRNTEELENVIRTSSTGGEQVITKTVQTFKTLADASEFSPPEEESVTTGQLHAPTGAPAPPFSAPQSGTSPSVHIDLQIHISPEASADQIDQVFASMAKHLYSQKQGK